MFNLLINLLTLRPVISFAKNIVRKVVGLFTRNVNPNARAYATTTAEEAVDCLPKVVRAVSQGFDIYQRGGAGLNLQTAQNFAPFLSDLISFPKNILNHYRNFKFLNTEQAPSTRSASRAVCSR